MSEMLTDLLQNIYNRISQLGKSIKSLQNSVDDLNSTLANKVQSLVNSISDMTESVRKEGEMQAYLFEEIGDKAVSEVQILQEKIGLKDLDEVLTKLSQITAASEEALRPETVDLLLHEVLGGIKQLKAPTDTARSSMSDEELLAKVDESLAHQEQISTQVQSMESESSDDAGHPKPPIPPKFVPPTPPGGKKKK